MTFMRADTSRGVQEKKGGDRVQNGMCQRIWIVAHARARDAMLRVPSPTCAQEDELYKRLPPLELHTRRRRPW